MRAVIFDCDGVIADTELGHLTSYQRVLAARGYTLTAADYRASYLGLDEPGVFVAFLDAQGAAYSAEILNDLLEHKVRVYRELIEQELVIFPGVRELARAAAARYPLAIASGALRPQIELILDAAGIRAEFQHVSSAEDVRRGKPDPEIFLHALNGLNASRADQPLSPADCLVIEDSRPGVRAARTAGMKVLAVTNTHAADELHEADLVVASLAEVDLAALQSHLW